MSAIVQGGDRCGRVLADLEVAGQAVNKAMVADGLAWHSARMPGWPLLSVRPEPLTVGYGPTRHPWPRGSGGQVTRAVEVQGIADDLRTDAERARD